MTDEIRLIAEEYKVTIYFKRRQDRGPLALVKSIRSRGHIVEEAACRLLYNYTSSSHLPDFTLQVDVSTPIHGNIIGRSGVNVQSMMQLTNTVIRFPRANLDSSIFISGPKDSVKTVHMYLQGILPIYLVFELVDDQVATLITRSREVEMDIEQMIKAFVEERAGVTIGVTHEHAKALVVTIKGTEGACGQLYKARAMVLGMAGVRGETGSENIDTDKNAFLNTIDDVKFAPQPQLALNIIQQLQDDIGCGTDNLWAKLPGNSEGVGEDGRSGGRSRGHGGGGGGGGGHSNRSKNPDSAPSDAGSITPTEHMAAAATVQDPVILAAGPVSTSSAGQGSVVHDIRLSPGGGKGFAKFQNSVPRKPAPASISPDIKKVQAEEAVKSADLSQARVPNAYWAGGGLSRSMPESELKRMQVPRAMPTLTESMGPMGGRGTGGKSPLNGASTPPTGSLLTRHLEMSNRLSESMDVSSMRYSRQTSAHLGDSMDSVNSVSSARSHGSHGSGGNSPMPMMDGPYPGSPTRPGGRGVRNSGGGGSGGGGSRGVHRSSPQDAAVVEYWNVSTIEELLKKLNLSKYEGQFAEEEIDLPTFLTLDDSDLKEIGIATIGARKKLHAAIQELKTMGSADRGLLTDMFAQTHGAKLSPPAKGLLKSHPMARGSLSSSGNGGLSGSFDSAGRRWSRTHNEKR